MVNSSLTFTVRKYRVVSQPLLRNLYHSRLENIPAMHSTMAVMMVLALFRFSFH